MIPRTVSSLTPAGQLFILQQFLGYNLSQFKHLTGIGGAGGGFAERVGENGMEKINKPGVYQTLVERFLKTAVLRPLRLDRYEDGTELTCSMQSVGGGERADVTVGIEKFVGGGFAGQVYRVRILKIDSPGSIRGLELGKRYAIKILVPPSRFSRLFRNLLYWVGFQGPFQLQVNPAAARSGALWQKLIRRGAAIRFGREDAVVDIFATFVDQQLGSCGEISEWVQGRTWRLEVDDRLDALNRWRRGRPVDASRLGSMEYRAKFAFMRDFVELLHDMGGHEFARQYEWTTCKSQPNCLKRTDSEADPTGGLVAVDFRAGLVLLPFLPMSPGDFGLILKGLKRGSLVQFDRGSLRRLDRFIAAHAEAFADLGEIVSELKECERVYRASVPDVTHHHVRLLYSRPLWSTILDQALTGWKVAGRVDASTAGRLERSTLQRCLFYLLGVVPLLGDWLQRIFGRADWRGHYRMILTSRAYLKRSFEAKMAEKMINWHRAGRFDDEAALAVSASPRRFLLHLPLCYLPVGLHRMLTDGAYARERLYFIFVRPLRLYFNAALREEWFRGMIREGRENHILTDGDAEVIQAQIQDPYIQKYLKSLAVHVCTLPVTQIVSVTIAVAFVLLHPEMPRSQAWGIGLGIIALFQVLPLSPGSLVRGFYVLYLVLRERNFKDYNIAVFLGFFKYIGYLAFPIQMAYRYPVLAGFMAVHWASQAVHVVPVFGESGALLEHWVFRLFYNWPLTLRRRVLQRLELRAAMQKRFWHIGLIALAAGVLLAGADSAYFSGVREFSGQKALWWLAIPVSLLGGTLTTMGAGGATLWQRIIGAVTCGLLTGIVYTAGSVLLPPAGLSTGFFVAAGIWRLFAFALFAVLGAIVTELILPDPEL